MNASTAQCCVCGKECWLEQSVPIEESGLIAPNGYEGITGGSAACKKCFDRHAKGELDWTETKF